MSGWPSWRRLTVAEPYRLHQVMSFSESEHPRAADGTFSEKVGAAPDIALAPKPPLTAKVVHQVWRGDYAVDTGEETEFDIRAVLDAVSLDDIRSMELSGDRDWLHDDAVIAGIIDSSNGPYYVETFYIEEQLEEYIAEREAAGQEGPVAELQPSQRLIRERAGKSLQGARNAIPLSILVMDGSDESDLSSESVGKIVASGIRDAQFELGALAAAEDRADDTDVEQLKALRSLTELVQYDRRNQPTVAPADRPKVVRVMARLNDYLWNRDNVLKD